MWELKISNLDATQALGQALGRVAGDGVRVGLEGDLGAGKTSFAQGVGLGLGVQEQMASPTFILLAEYDSGRLPLLHGDAYRLERGEAHGIGMGETIEDWPGLVLLEWADRLPGILGEDCLTVEISHESEGRRMKISATGPVHQDVLERWKAAFLE